jgi:hypothetical protein
MIGRNAPASSLSTIYIGVGMCCDKGSPGADLFCGFHIRPLPYAHDPPRRSMVEFRLPNPSFCHPGDRISYYRCAASTKVPLKSRRTNVAWFLLHVAAYGCSTWSVSSIGRCGSTFSKMNGLISPVRVA